MVYFLKKSTPSKKGLYLQIYKSFYVPGKGKRNKSFKTIGYVSDLIASGIDDPVSFYQKEVDKLNDELDNRNVPQIGDVSSCKNLGYFLLKGVLDKLNIDKYLDLVSANKSFRFQLSQFIRALIYAQVANPGSKLKAFENVIPSLYNVTTFSYDQILDGIEYIGMDYTKFIELFNHQIDKVYGRNTNFNFFDCTNYYFEIDLEDSFRLKGPSKEERHNPIVGQALLLDAEQIPIGMMLYPGNQSEKPFLRNMIEDTKSRYDINGRIIQVADKGLNCARNIYAACIEANDGYIFSKSIHGKNLDGEEKKWVIREDKDNVWVSVNDSNGNLKYKYKECVDLFSYKCILDENDKEYTHFTVKEKRIVTYNPSLAKKQRQEIRKQVEKVKSLLSIKAANRAEYGDAVKYVNFNGVDDDGKIVKISSSLNLDKIKEDLLYAGYNLLVTSELNMPAQEIYNAYHGLWKIEESFRIMKSYLDARPVFLQKEESICGHFLICYLALTILRLLEIKEFNNEISVSQIIEFIRQYSVTDSGEGLLINNAIKSKTFLKIKEILGLSKLGNAFLKIKDIDSFLNEIF